MEFSHTDLQGWDIALHIQSEISEDSCREKDAVRIPLGIFGTIAHRRHQGGAFPSSKWCK